MNETAIRAQLGVMRSAADEIERLLPPAADGPVFVHRGDNLFSQLEQAPAGRAFLIDADFEQAGDFEWTKPLRVESAERSRATLYGTQTIRADVDFVEMGFAGVIPEWPVLKLLNVDGTGPSFVNPRIRGSVKGQRRGVLANGVGGLFDGGSITNIWAKEDAQAIYSDDGMKGLRVRGMHLEASGEVIMFGGGDPSSEDRIPCDWAVTACTLTRPLAWRGRDDMTVKNLFEIKNSKRGRFEGNVCEYSWAQGQVGWGLVLTVRNQDGAAPFSTIEDIIIADNVFRHMANGIQILGRDNRHPSGIMRNVLLEDNVFEDVDPVAWGAVSGKLVYIAGGPKNLNFVRTTMRGRNLNSAFYFEGRQADGSIWPAPCEQLVIVDHEADEGEYGVKGDSDGSGAIVLAHYAPGYEWRDVRLHRKPDGAHYAYPEGTTIIEDAA